MKAHRWFIEKDEKGEYCFLEFDPSKHLCRAYKFIYYIINDESILIIGDENVLVHYGLFFAAEEFLNNNLPKLPIGAGTIMGKKVISWDSEGFGVITPMKLRSQILELLGIEG